MGHCTGGIAASMHMGNSHSHGTCGIQKIQTPGYCHHDGNQKMIRHICHIYIFIYTSSSISDQTSSVKVETFNVEGSLKLSAQTPVRTAAPETSQSIDQRLQSQKNRINLFCTKALPTAKSALVLATVYATQS